jgi:hypothetical protein
MVDARGIRHQGLNDEYLHTGTQPRERGHLPPRRANCHPCALASFPGDRHRDGGSRNPGRDIADNGLVADTSRLGSPCSIAVVGFALSCYPVAVARGWMSRSDAALLVLKTLHFFSNSSQGKEPDATGFKGFYDHFLQMQTGRRVW